MFYLVSSTILDMIESRDSLVALSMDLISSIT
jgi:hypothetical protein